MTENTQLGVQTNDVMLKKDVYKPVTGQHESGFNELFLIHETMRSSPPSLF